MCSNVQESYCEAEENSEKGSACQLQDTNNKCSDKYRSNVWSNRIIRFWSSLFDGMEGSVEMEEKPKETKEEPREVDEKTKKMEAEPNHDQDEEDDSLDSLCGKDYDQDSRRLHPSTEKNHEHSTFENLNLSEEMHSKERDREYKENYEFGDISKTVCSTSCNEGHCKHVTLSEIDDVDGFQFVSSFSLEIGTQNEFPPNHDEIVKDLQTEDQVESPSLEELYEDGNVECKERSDNVKTENYARPEEEESVKLKNPDLSKDCFSKSGLLASKHDEQKHVDIALNREHMDSTECLPCYFMYDWWQSSISTTSGNMESIPTEERMEKMQSFKQRKMRTKETDTSKKVYKNLEREFKEKQHPKKTNFLHTNQSSTELEMPETKRNKKGCFLRVLKWILGIPDTRKRVPRKPFPSVLDNFFVQNPLETSTSEEDEPQEFSDPIDWKKLVGEV